MMFARSAGRTLCWTLRGDGWSTPNGARFSSIPVALFRLRRWPSIIFSIGRLPTRHSGRKWPPAFCDLRCPFLPWPRASGCIRVKGEAPPAAPALDPPGRRGDRGGGDEADGDPQGMNRAPASHLARSPHDPSILHPQNIVATAAPLGCTFGPRITVDNGVLSTV